MVTFLSMPGGLVIPSPARNWSAWNNPAKLSRSRGNCKARRRLPRIAARYPLLPVQQGGQELPRFAPSRSDMERVAPFRCGHFSICRARFRAGIDCFASVYFQACPGSRIRGLGMTGPPLANSSGVIAFGPAARVGRRHSGHRYWDSRTQNAPGSWIAACANPSVATIRNRIAAAPKNLDSVHRFLPVSIGNLGLEAQGVTTEVSRKAACSACTTKEKIETRLRFCQQVLMGHSKMQFNGAGGWTDLDQLQSCKCSRQTMELRHA